MSKTNIKLSVDTTEIDRVAIGSRLYDAFDNRNTHNKLHVDDGVIYMTEKDINEMYQLVNAGRTQNNIQVYRSE